MSISVKNIPLTFGRHETFSIRDGWLSKGIIAVNKNPNALHKVDSHHDIGVGINMLKSIRYRLQASNLVSIHDHKFYLTDLGKLIFENDKYMEFDGTWWIIHMELSTNLSLCSSW